MAKTACSRSPTVFPPALTAGLALLFLAACNSTAAPPRAAPDPVYQIRTPFELGYSTESAFEPTDRFLSLDGDPRVLYESDGEDLAWSVAEYLDRAVATVERYHGRPFRQPVRIHVFSNPRNFALHSPSPSAAGVTVGGELFLSPRLAEVPGRICQVLTHELAHLHFTQHLGPREAYQILPRWFAEGFAIVVSGDQSDRVSKAEAAIAIREGKQLDLTGSPQQLFAAGNDFHGLEPHMFYRQSEMFIEFLQTRYGPRRFNALLNRLFGGEQFPEAFWAAFGRPLPVAWTEFVGSLT